MGVTEFASFNLVAGTSVDKKESSEGVLWRTVLDIVKSQPGCQRIYYGTKVEDASRLDLLVDWDEYEDHQRFMQSIVYGPFLKQFMTLVAPKTELDMLHIPFQPDLPASAIGISSPVTEILKLFIEDQEGSTNSNEPSPALQKKQDELSAKVKEFEAIIQQAAGCKGISSGWAREDVKHENFDKDKSGKVFIVAIGWTGVQAHMDFRATTAFQDKVHLIRGPEVKAAQVSHTSFQPV